MVLGHVAQGASLMEPILVTRDTLIFICAEQMFILVALVVIVFRQEKLMSSQGQGFQDLNNEVTSDTAQLTAEQQAFQGLETAIQNLLAAGSGGVTDTQLEALAQALKANQVARAAAIATAVADTPPAPAAPSGSAPAPSVKSAS